VVADARDGVGVRLGVGKVVLWVLSTEISEGGRRLGTDEQNGEEAIQTAQWSNCGC